MARGHVQVLVTDMRSDYLDIAVFLLYLAQELFETVAEGGAFGEPQGQAGAYVLREREEFHFLAELAVVAFFRLLEQGEVFVEHLFLGESDAVDTHELVALLIAAPVSASE